MVSLKSASLGSVGNTPCARETDTAPTRVATLAARASVSKPAAMRTRKSADVISIPCGTAHDGWVQGHATGVVVCDALTYGQTETDRITPSLVFRPESFGTLEQVSKPCKADRQVRHAVGEPEGSYYFSVFSSSSLNTWTIESASRRVSLMTTAPPGANADGAKPTSPA